jgi:hypothetical protein
VTPPLEGSQQGPGFPAFPSPRRDGFGSSPMVGGDRPERGPGRGCAPTRWGAGILPSSPANGLRLPPAAADRPYGRSRSPGWPSAHQYHLRGFGRRYRRPADRSTSSIRWARSWLSRAHGTRLST